MSNRNIYRRYDDRFEVGYRDSSGKQRWSPPFDTIQAARKMRDEVMGRKATGEHVQPNPKLTFGEAADKWLAEQVVELRPATRDIYSNAVENHLRPRWGSRRLDRLTVNDTAQVVRELRAKGLAERSIGGVVAVANRIFKFAARRMAWHGVNPIALMENGERPRGTTGKRRIYQGDELGQVLAAATEPWKTLFALACVSGARKSEILGLHWDDFELDDADDASVHIAVQVDRQGRRQPLKTEDSARTIELPSSLAAMLVAHRSQAVHCGERDFVFATRSGNPISQRNVLRALRRAQKQARMSDGKPTFPVLHEGGPVPRGAVPNFHGFRHSAASHAIAEGESVEEISWMLGHKNSLVTRQVYVQEVKSAERRARQRAAMEARYGSVLAGAAGPAEPMADEGEVVPLRLAAG